MVSFWGLLQGRKQTSSTVSFFKKRYWLLTVQTVFSAHFQLLVLLKNWAVSKGPGSCSVVMLALTFLGTLTRLGLEITLNGTFAVKKNIACKIEMSGVNLFCASFPSATSFPQLPILKKTPVGVWHKAKQSSWQSLTSRTIPVVLSN